MTVYKASLSFICLGVTSRAAAAVPQSLARMAAATDTFGVPLKKASDIDILKPLKNLITSRYQTADQESYVSAINDLARLRSSAVCRTLDNHESSLETLYR